MSSMCIKIDLNVIFPYVIALQWTIVNTIGIFIVVILLLYYWIEMVLLCCDFNIFTGCINMKYKIIREKVSILYRWNYEQHIKYKQNYWQTKSFGEFSRVEKNYKIFSLTITVKIIDGLSPSNTFRKLKKNYRTLLLKITYGIINKLSPSRSSRELEKN